MRPRISLLTLFVFGASAVAAQAAVVWQVGAPGRGWPIDGVGGGPDVDFLQENGVLNPLPGSPTSGTDPRTSDNDYYFEGSYPAFVVPVDETGAERAFASADTLMRFHHNLTGINPTDLLTVSFEANNLDERVENSDPRMGIQISINGTLIMPEIIIRPAELNTVFTTMPVSAASVGVNAGPGFDNTVELGAINYNASGGGNWMGIDYVQLDATPIPEPSSGLLGFFAAAALLLLRRSRA